MPSEVKFPPILKLIIPSDFNEPTSKLPEPNLILVWSSIIALPIFTKPDLPIMLRLPSSTSTEPNLTLVLSPITLTELPKSALFISISMSGLSETFKPPITFTSSSLREKPSSVLLGLFCF